MSDCVIDTNVLLVASAAEPFSPFDDTHVPAREQLAVFEWLQAFRGDSARRLVLDDLFKIYEEYRHKLSDQDYGLQVVHEKMEMFRTAEIAWNDDGSAVVPVEFSDFDPSDRKFLAAVLTAPETIDLVNAADSDWLEIEAELAAVGVRVIHIIEEWLRKSYGRVA